jgi:hypothetical protein
MLNTNEPYTPKTIARRGRRAWTPSRCRIWVGGIVARYLRRPAAAGGPERVLATLRPLTVVRERWLLASQTLFPRIHFAIQPLLRRLQQAPAMVAAGARADLRVERTFMTLHDGAPVPRSICPSAPVRASRPDPASHGVASERALRPLALVLQRLREPERLTAVALRAQALGARRAIARDVAERWRRAEHVSASAPVRVLAARDMSPATASAVQGSAAAPVAGGRGSDRRGVAVPQQAAPNIAALADRVMQHIDDRLHAWQERTGF